MMAERMVQVGCRVPQEDAEFLGRVKIDGAITPSDKLRVIIKQARLRDEGAQDYDSALITAKELLEPVLNEVRRFELHSEKHSELVTGTVGWLVEFLAFVVSGAVQSNDADAQERMIAFEKNVADRIVRNANMLFQLALVDGCHCYDPDVLERNVDKLHELACLLCKVKNEEEKNHG